MVTRNQLIDWGVSRDIGDLTQYRDRSGMSDQEENPTTRLQVYSRVTPIIDDSNDIVSHVGANPNPSDGMVCLMMESASTFLKIV